MHPHPPGVSKFVVFTRKRLLEVQRKFEEDEHKSAEDTSVPKGIENCNGTLAVTNFHFGFKFPKAKCS